ERLSIDLAEGLPSFHLVVSRIFPESTPLLEQSRVSIEQLGSASTGWIGRIPEAIWCFKHRTVFLRDAKQVIYSGLYSPMAVSNQNDGKKVYYCHTPPRYAYDLSSLYKQRVPLAVRPFLSAGVSWLRREYVSALSQMDVIITNSQNVQHRLRDNVGFESVVVHPPINVNRFRWLGDEGYFVSIARLEPNKRVDVIIKAFLQMPEQRLVVLSGGSEQESLRKLASGAPNIHFTGWQSEQKLQKWIGNARAAIYLPIDEDFGMSPVEAMAAGKPVIGVAEGGLLETIVHGETGQLLEPPPTIEDVIRAVIDLTSKHALAMRQACEARAQLFSREIFLEKMDFILGAC
ncbi:partial GDP-mannose-dependent alpha-(1-6)-phosphatidylinositol monomannoside mannosyltransferase, partial [Methylococcales bacterium]